eukprot:m.461999 g.461999  ORF g.461999 m.461999 type:complete len:309 (-) comp20348_c0_seq23:2807-3733(-)
MVRGPSGLTCPSRPDANEVFCVNRRLLVDLIAPAVGHQNGVGFGCNAVVGVGRPDAHNVVVIAKGNTTVSSAVIVDGGVDAFKDKSDVVAVNGTCQHLNTRRNSVARTKPKVLVACAREHSALRTGADQNNLRCSIHTTKVKTCPPLLTVFACTGRNGAPFRLPSRLGVPVGCLPDASFAFGVVGGHVVLLASPAVIDKDQEACLVAIVLCPGRMKTSVTAALVSRAEKSPQPYLCWSPHSQAIGIVGKHEATVLLVLCIVVNASGTTTLKPKPSVVAFGHVARVCWRASYLHLVWQSVVEVVSQLLV